MAEDKSATLAQSIRRLADDMVKIQAMIRSLSQETIGSDEYVALQVMRMNVRGVYDELKSALRRRRRKGRWNLQKVARLLLAK